MILRIEYFLGQGANGTDDPGLRMQEARASHIHQLVGAARSFHSSASTVAANRSTISEGSITDFPLHSDQRQQISDWIQLPTISDKDLEWNLIPSQNSGSDIDAELPALVTSLALIPDTSSSSAIVPRSPSERRPTPLVISEEPPKVQVGDNKVPSEEISSRKLPPCSGLSSVKAPMPSTPPKASDIKRNSFYGRKRNTPPSATYRRQKTDACMQTLQGYGSPVSSVAFSADSQRIVSGSGDNTIKVWESETGACTQTLEGHKSWVYSVAFSADGQYIVSGSHDNTIRTWESKTGACAQTLKGHGSSVSSVAFSASSQRIVSGSHDRTIKIWESETGACTQT